MKTFTFTFKVVSCVDYEVKADNLIEAEKEIDGLSDRDIMDIARDNNEYEYVELTFIHEDGKEI